MSTIFQNKIPDNDSLFKPMFLSEKIVNPKREWLILMILFGSFVLVSAGYDFYMYKKIVSGDMYVSVNREELIVKSLKSSDLQKILNSFETKQINIMNLKLENLVDPSI